MARNIIRIDGHFESWKDSFVPIMPWGTKVLFTSCACYMPPHYYIHGALVEVFHCKTSTNAGRTHVALLASSLLLGNPDGSIPRLVPGRMRVARVLHSTIKPCAMLRQAHHYALRDTLGIGLIGSTGPAEGHAGTHTPKIIARHCEPFPAPQFTSLSPNWHTLHLQLSRSGVCLNF
jgi:hypothetical protein